MIMSSLQEKMLPQVKIYNYHTWYIRFQSVNNGKTAVISYKTDFNPPSIDSTSYTVGTASKTGEDATFTWGEYSDSIR